jgi:hypothetical protein
MTSPSGRPRDAEEMGHILEEDLHMRESFVKMCEDKDVQRLTWESYTEKKLVRKSPLAHVKIFLKDMAHLLGIARPT